MTTDWAGASVGQVRAAGAGLQSKAGQQPAVPTEEQTSTIQPPKQPRAQWRTRQHAALAQGRSLEGSGAWPPTTMMPVHELAASPSATSLPDKATSESSTKLNGLKAAGGR